jgi:hypothetical protein
MAQTVTPLPSTGDVIVGRDIAGRALRISGHPESDRVVLSIWQQGRCLATVRLARADVPEVARALVAGLIPAQEAPQIPGRPVGIVSDLRSEATAQGSLRGVADRVATAVTTRLPAGLTTALRRYGPRR